MFDGKWHCAEWHIYAAVQSYHFYFDGAEVTSIAKNNGAGQLTVTGIPDAFTSIAVDLYNYQAVTSGFTVWIDDLAVTADRVGCPEP